jgi:hypothetical protein
MEYLLNTNAAMLLDLGYTKGKLHIGGVRQRKETKNLNGAICSKYRNEYRSI